jgi:predicted PurR-regulated permease PerM
MAVQFVSFTDDLPMLRQRFGEIFSQLQHWISRELHITTKTQSDYLSRSSGSIVESAAGSVKNVFFSLSTILLWTIFIILFTFFMLFHRRLLNRFILHLFKPHDRTKVSEILRETKAMINSYIQALLIEMLVLSVVNSTLFLAIGIRYALLLGVMAACLNIIPYLGMYSSIFITFLVTFANSGANTALAASVGLFCVHLVDSNVLMPRLVGRRVKMNPFITILAVMIGEFVWGVPGMFLFIPIAGIVKLVCERVDSLEAWGILIGVEEKEPVPPQKAKQSD